MATKYRIDDPVFNAAAAFRQAWADLGCVVGEISHSTNRFGGKSAYFDVAGHGRLRVSDHSTSQDYFSARQRTVIYTSATAETAERMKARDDDATAKWQAEHGPRIEAERNAMAEREARITAEAELAERRRRFWDEQLNAVSYAGSRANAIKKHKAGGIVCPF